MDLREKMQMLRQAQEDGNLESVAVGVATSRTDGKANFDTDQLDIDPTIPIVNKALVEEPVEVEEPDVTVEAEIEEEPKQKRSFGSKTAEKRLLMKISKQLEELTSDKYMEKLADIVVKKINEDLDNA